jgi:hypothetical protein
MLFRKVLVQRNEAIKAMGKHQVKQLAVLLSGPAERLDGCYGMTRKIRQGLLREILIEQKFQLPPRRSGHFLAGSFQQCDNLIPANGGKITEKLFDGFPFFKKIKKSLDWNTCPSKHRSSAQNLRINLDH